MNSDVDTDSQVSFQGYNLPYKLCGVSIINDSSKFKPLYLQVLFYETPDFIGNLVYYALWIHDTAFMYNTNADYDVLVLTAVTGKLSHHVSLENVSWCDNRFRHQRHSLLRLGTKHCKPFPQNFCRTG